jgi:hypothetical protein
MTDALGALPDDLDQASGMSRRLGLGLVAGVLALALAPTGALARGESGPAPVRSAARHIAEFYAPRALGVECEIDDGAGLVGVHCQSTRLKPFFGQVAELDATGLVTVCVQRRLTGSCPFGNAGERTPTLSYGKRIIIGRFTCQTLHAGVKCTLTASGKGFLMSRSSVVAVGGAQTRPAPLRIASFLSPDRKVWCGIGEGRGFCATGGFDPGAAEPQRSATFASGGTVTLCSVAAPSVREGCIQNWDAAAPVLRYGQQSELEGVLCTSEPNGITCVQTAGAGKGKGFRVSSGEAVEVG